MIQYEIYGVLLNVLFLPDVLVSRKSDENLDDQQQ